MEHETRVFAVRLNLICDDCGEVMDYTGAILLSHPPQYEHRCVCGNTQKPSKKYPCIEHREIVEDQNEQS